MKLLDHKEYDHAELIEKMYEDAFYYGEWVWINAYLTLQ